MKFLRSQPTAVWAVAAAAVVSFMGLGLVDPILPAIAHDLHASPSDVELLFTSYFAFTGAGDAVLQRRRQPDRHEAHAAHRAGADHRLQRIGGAVEQRRRDRRAARRLGTWQRAVHRDRAVGDRRLGQRRRRRRGDDLRGGARPRDLARPAARRRAWRDQLARPVLRRRRADGHRLHRDRAVPAADTSATRATSASRCSSRCARCATAPRAAAA